MYHDVLFVFDSGAPVTISASVDSLIPLEQRNTLTIGDSFTLLIEGKEIDARRDRLGTVEEGLNILGMDFAEGYKTFPVIDWETRTWILPM